MTVLGKLTGAVCAAALAAGLAACGGGGGGGSGGADPAATERAAALAAALRAARATGAAGAFDDARYGVAPTVTASGDGSAVTIAVTETGTPSGGRARSGKFAELEDGPAGIGGWSGARLGRGAAERLTVYSDVGPPEAMAFTPENLNRLREVSGLTGDTVPASGLGIVPGWFPLIRTTSGTVTAATSPGGSAVYRAQGSAGLEFEGTFAGGAGNYRCTGAACSVTLDDKGRPSAMDGSWFFAPTADAEVHVPDYDHLYFGWWVHGRDDGPYGFQSFAGAAGYAPDTGTPVAVGMTGTATYRGAAAGVWATVDTAGGKVTSAVSGEFTARATIDANFIDEAQAGFVNGSIHGFRDANGRVMADWRITLKGAPLAAAAAVFSAGTSGTVGPGTTGGSGHWQGVFHGGGGADHQRPDGVTGRFDLHLPGAHVAGAFGATR